MKKILIAILVVLVGCKSNQSKTGDKLQAKDCRRKYKVIMLDSTTNNYLVYLKKSNKKFLVISSKNDPRIEQLSGVGKKLKKGKRYPFNNLEKYSVGFVGVPQEIYQALDIDGREVWSNKSDFKVYTSKNLAGLYFVVKR